MDLLCVGLVVYDTIIKPIDEDVFQKDTIILDTLLYKPGGDAFNVASGASKLGIPTTLIGRVGNDPPGALLRTSAQKLGINSDYLISDPKASTATSIVLVSSDGERHFAYSPGANFELVPDDVPISLIRKAKHLHLSGAMLLKKMDGDGLAQLFEAAHQNNVTTSMDVAYDPDNLWIKKIDKALRHTDIFLPSLQEAQEITGCKTPEKIAEMLSQYPIKVLVIKLGADGCFVQTSEESFYLPAFTHNMVVDTTGAGDCFVSVFIAMTMKGYSPKEAALFANAGASCYVSQIGADSGFKSIAELKELVSMNSKTT